MTPDRTNSDDRGKLEKFMDATTPMIYSSWVGSGALIGMLGGKYCLGDYDLSSHKESFAAFFMMGGISIATYGLSLIGKDLINYSHRSR